MEGWGAYLGGGGEEVHGVQAVQRCIGHTRYMAYGAHRLTGLMERAYRDYEKEKE